ncbi:MAG: hypothetical protein VYE32_04665, partial [Candidatus Thermoplasmatota archaeon]|nr:hypothetical protein [Candidatus Thermoplasmatota archaeon]
MEKPTGSAPAGAKDQVEKQARQLAYDVRYKVRGALKAQSGGKSDPATVRKAYLSQLGKSPASPPVKARAKDMLVGESYVDVNKLATESAVSALYRVFVEGIHEQEEIQEESGDKTYKVRVTDKKSGNSYVRMASRAKISELRSNPNISSVEMTGYGEPARSEKYSGKKTAAAKAGKDFDGDGKKESSSKEHAGVVHNAIQKKKGGVPDGKDTRKEDYSWKDGFSELIEKKKEEKKLTGKGVNNKKLIKVFPVEENTIMDPKASPGSGLSGLGGMDVEGAKEKGAQKQIDAKQKKADQIKKQVLLKKLQAVRMGGGEDIVASHKPEGEIIEDKDHEDKVRSQIRKMNYKDEADYEAKARAAANASERRRKQKDNAARVRRSEQGAARRRENRNYLRSIGKYKGPMEGVEMKPEDKTPEGMGDITFDAGGAIPTTIKAIGDPREIETAIKLKKTQLRASGLNCSHEPEGELVETKSKIDSSRKSYLSGSRRNKARFGKEGSMTKRGYYGQYPSEYSEMGDKRREEHRKKRGVKTKGTVAADIKKSIKETAANEAYTVTNADKTANNKAYQDMKAGKKNAVTGEPLYKKADHMGENLVTISNINVKPSDYTTEKDVIKEILEKGTKGKIGFRSGGQFKDTGKKTSDGTPIKKYVQSMKTD